MELELLNQKVSEVIANIDTIKARHEIELKPYRDKIEALNEEFLNSKLIDMKGAIIRAGMIIKDDKGVEYKVLRRYQQKLFGFLGNAQLEVLKIGGKRCINIHYKELKYYLIVNTTDKP